MNINPCIELYHSVLGISFHFGTFLLISIAHIHLHSINEQLSSLQNKRLHLEKRADTSAFTVFSWMSH